ncbi:MAG: RNA polymerase subunit sigma-70, partial [Candidatus Marinimicrobia bacterium]|nr:RNA polymerase subunit sigma-70 [Candidatus Neomarinimicrobiota bacterium]
VVQLNGGISRAEYDTHATEIAQKISEKYRAIPFLLPLPAIVDNADLKQAIISDKNISRTLDLAHKAKVAMFTIGSFSHDSVLVKADYFETKEVDSLLKRGAVGDICSRIITHDGKICSPELNSRTIGIELEELCKKSYSIAVAGGKEKLQAIRAGLCGHLFNVLITDEWVAEELLRD